MAWRDLGDIVLCSEEAGQGGPAIVLIHELGGSLGSFDVLAQMLAREHRVLRYDQRGAGLSEKPREAFDLDDHARDLAGLLDAVGFPTPCHLLGIAAGAAIAVAFALATPERAASLTLCAPALTVPPERRDYLAERSRLAESAGMRAVAEASLARSYPPVLRGDGDAFMAYRAAFLANDPVSYAHANRALAQTRVGERLGALSVPVLVLAGRHDLLRPPAEVEPVAKRIPGARYAEIESGHLMSVQAPAAIARDLAAFLAALPDTGRT